MSKVHPIGIIANENKPTPPSRASILREWVLPYWPDCPIYGKWTPEGAAEIGRPLVGPIPVEFMLAEMETWSSTLIMPASGSGWATAKPWEAFSAGVVCFFHPGYDTGDSILCDAPDWLRAFLRPMSAEELPIRADFIHEDADARAKIVYAQREHFQRVKYSTRWGLRAIEDRLGFDTTKPIKEGQPYANRL